MKQKDNRLYAPSADAASSCAPFVKDGRRGSVAPQSGQSGRLSDLRIGQRARVLKMAAENAALKRRLLDMGLVEGVELMLSKVAPLGDPISLELRGYELCVRKADLTGILVEVL